MEYILAIAKGHCGWGNDL